LLIKCFGNRFFFLWASLSVSDFALRATTGQADPTRTIPKSLKQYTLFLKKYPFRSTNLEPWDFEPEFFNKKAFLLRKAFKSLNAGAL